MCSRYQIVRKANVVLPVTIFRKKSIAKMKVDDTFSKKEEEELEALKNWVNGKIKYNKIVMRKKSSEQDYHYDAKELFEPIKKMSQLQLKTYLNHLMSQQKELNFLMKTYLEKLVLQLIQKAPPIKQGKLSHQNMLKIQ